MHGWSGSTDSFKPVQFFLSKNHYCINLDLWGMGNSAEANNFSIYDYVQNIVFLLNILQVEKVSIIAHSFGGRIALALAYLHKNLVDKMILCGCAGLKPKRKLSYYFAVAKFKIIKTFFKNQLKTKKFGSLEYQILSKNMQKTYKNAVNFNQKFMLKSIKNQTLLYFSKKDTATPYYMAKTFEKKLTNSALITKENSTHFAYLENLEEFCLICSSFLK